MFDMLTCEFTVCDIATMVETEATKGLDERASKYTMNNAN